MKTLDDATAVVRDEAKANRLKRLARNATLREVELVRFKHAGLLMVSLTVVAFVIWASQAELNEVAVAAGTIVPDGQVITIQHLEGGIVRSINVSEGSAVGRGDILIEFNGEAMRSELTRLNHRRISLELRSERLRALLQQRQPEFPEVPRSLIRAREEELLAFEAQRRDWDEEIDLLAQTKQVLMEELNSANATMPVRTELLGIARQELEMFESLIRRGNTSELKLLEANRKYREERLEMVELTGRLSNLTERIQEIEKQIDRVDAERRQVITAELSSLNAELNDVTQTIIDWTDRVNRLAVRAPVAGVVQQLAVQSIGSVVAPGGLVAEIVPSDEPLLAEARLSPLDVGFVQVGQPVEVKIQAFDFSRYGSIKGSVDHISATTFLDEMSQPYYKALVSLEQAHVGGDPDRNHLRPGMTLQADISTGKKTFLEYLLKPVFVNVAEGFRER